MNPGRLPFARQGNVAIIVCVSLTVLLMFGAIAVDIGWARLVSNQLQLAADASAHAGAAQLNGTSAGITAARAMATTIARDNSAGGSAVSLSTSDIAVGVYDTSSRTFTVSSDAASVNAVKIRARHPGLGLFLAPVLGQDTIDLDANAIMVAGIGGGAGAVGCFLPFALPSCDITNHGVSGIQFVDQVLNPAGVDNIGWGRPNGTPDASWDSAQITSCSASGTAAVGDPVGLANGAVQSALTTLSSALKASTTRWNTTLWGTEPAKMTGSDLTAAQYGHTFEGVIAVFDGGTDYCSSSASWNQTKTITGFIWASVYDIRTSGNTSGRTFKMRLDTTDPRVYGTRSGGPDYGVTAAASPPRLYPSD